MSKKNNKPHLSKGILEMKFMQRTKAKVVEENEACEGMSMYEKEISEKMLHSHSNFIIEPSFIYCEDLIEGRFSFRGMNPEIERLLELEEAERQAVKHHDQHKEVSDTDMMEFYQRQKAPAVSITMGKKFNKGKKAIKRSLEVPNEIKKKKFLKPREDD